MENEELKHREELEEVNSEAGGGATGNPVRHNPPKKSWLKRNWGWVLILIILLSFITYLILRPTVQFNKVELDPNLNVWNQTEMSYLDTIVSVGITQLGIEPKFVLLRDLVHLPKEIDGYEVKSHIRYNKLGGFVIYIQPMGRTECIDVLSHELIHVKQFMNDGYDVGLDTLVYKGKVYTSENMPKYEDRPWEQEAFILGPHLARDIKSVLIKK